jgi:hypothetical protein
VGFFQDEKKSVVDVQNILNLYGLLHIYQMLRRRNVRRHPANFLSTHISLDAATDRSVVSARRLCRTIPPALSVSNGEYDLAHAGTTNDGAFMPAGALAGWLANEPNHPIHAPAREWLDHGRLAAGNLRELDLGTVAPSCAPTETICCIGTSCELRASFHPDRAVRCLLKVGNVSFLRQTSAKPFQAKLAGAPIAINLRCLKFSGKYVPNLVRLTLGASTFNSG